MATVEENWHTSGDSDIANIAVIIIVAVWGLRTRLIHQCMSIYISKDKQETLKIAFLNLDWTT